MRTVVGMRSFCAGLLILGAACAIGFGQTPANRTASPNRIGPIDEAQVVTLEGNQHPLAREEFDRGAVGAETRLARMVLLLEPSAAQQAGLDALVEAQHDPHSPLYRQWLTPAGYGTRFGVSAEDVSRVAGWLKGHGFAVDELPASNRLIVFSGTAAQVAETFHTGIHRYLADGVEHLANSENPQIPAALAGVVGGVVSLHDFRRRSEIKTRTALATEAVAGERSFVGAQPLYTSGGTHYLFPADWAAIYDLNPLYDAGTKGVGSSIAIAGRSNIELSDVAAFRTIAGLAANDPTVILAGADPGVVAGDRDEATLDVEWSGAVAPAATVVLVAAGSTATTDGVDLAAEYVVNHALAQVVSVSYGSCEQQMGTTELAFYNSLWEQAASEGMSVFVASGDAGAAGCYGGSSTVGSGTAVNGLCSSPYATCVGGTEVNEGANPAQYWAATNAANYGTALGYIPEEVWNESGLNGGAGLWASGGGSSVVYAQPPWQNAVSGTSAANGMRAVPDVSVTAAAHDGYVVYENGSYYVVSGTSAGAPAFAGLMSLVVERQGGTGVGNANPGLYSLLNAEVNPFHATRSGNNSVPGVGGFAASGAEYNLATGLGSVDGALLVNQWEAGGAASADFTIVLAGGSSSSATVLPGGTVVESFTVSPANGAGVFANAIRLTASGLPAGATAVFSPASVPAGSGTTTVTLVIQLPQTSAGSEWAPLGGAAGRLAPLTLALLLLPLAGRLRRGGKRIGRPISLLLLAMAGLSGCGSIGGSLGQTSQTYTVSVTGTSGTLSHSATVTLTVE